MLINLQLLVWHSLCKRQLMQCIRMDSIFLFIVFTDTKYIIYNSCCESAQSYTTSTL